MRRPLLRRLGAAGRSRIVKRGPMPDLGDAPARHLLALRERLAQLQTEQTGEQGAACESDTAADAAPLFITTALSDQSHARTMMLNRRRIIAARKSVTM